MARCSSRKFWLFNTATSSPLTAINSVLAAATKLYDFEFFSKSRIVSVTTVVILYFPFIKRPYINQRNVVILTFGKFI